MTSRNQLELWGPNQSIGDITDWDERSNVDESALECTCIMWSVGGVLDTWQAALVQNSVHCTSTQLTPNRLNEPANVSRFGCWEERDDGLDKLSKQRH